MYRAFPDRDATPHLPFSFEHVWEMSEAEFLALHQFPRHHSRRALAKLSAVAAVGLLLLLAPYSATIGVLLLLLTALIWNAPRMLRKALSERFIRSSYLRGPVAYGVSRAGIWLKGAHFSGESTWEGLDAWREQDDWLLLSASGLPTIYLPIRPLRQQGLYEAVLFLARAHGRSLDAPARARDHSDVPG